MGHEHGHEHAADPEMVQSLGSGRFALGLGLNVVFVVAEVAFGMISGSMALITDAAHNLSDVAGLALAWWAAVLAGKSPTKHRTYGFRKAPILAALANALMIMGAVGAISWEAVDRMFAPAKVSGSTMIGVAAVGVVVNALAAVLFMKGRHRDINVRAAFVHLAADAAVSIGVVLAGVAIVMTGRAWIDPLVSLGISVVIVIGTWSLLRASLDLAMDAVPTHIDPDSVRAYLAQLSGVGELHDLHIWAMSAHETALTAHLGVDEDGHWSASKLRRVSKELSRRFGIGHVTLQVEPCLEGEEPCPQADERKA